MAGPSHVRLTPWRTWPHSLPMAEEQRNTLRGIDPELWKQVKAAAALGGQTLAGWVAQALKCHLEATGPPKEEER